MDLKAAYQKPSGLDPQSKRRKLRLREWKVLKLGFFIPKVMVELPGDSVVKNPAASAVEAGDSASISGWADPLEEEMATRSSSLVRKIP